MRTTATLLFVTYLSLGGRAALAAADDAKVDLKVGDAAPSFQALSERGQMWKSSDHVGKKIIVIYFYPGDFTPGCIKQAESFRDRMNDLNYLEAEVVGVSGDAVMTHALFKLAMQLNYTLLADEDAALAKRFGVPVGKGGEVKTKDADGKPVTLQRAVTAARWTFIIGLDGKVIYKNTKVNPVEDAKQVAATIEKLDKK